MSWEAVGAIGQMLGSIAVFITLGYLAVQVRHSRQETRRSINQIRAEGWCQIQLNRANNERFIGPFVRANAALTGGSSGHPFVVAMSDRLGSAIAPEETWVLYFDQYAAWLHQTQSIPHVDALTPGERAAFDAGMRSMYTRHPLGRFWYETVKSELNPDAVRYVDNLLAQAS